MVAGLAYGIGCTPALSVTQKRRCSCGMRLGALYKCYYAFAFGLAVAGAKVVKGMSSLTITDVGQHAKSVRGAGQLGRRRRRSVECPAASSSTTVAFPSLCTRRRTPSIRCWNKRFSTTTCTSFSNLSRRVTLDFVTHIFCRITYGEVKSIYVTSL